MHQIRVLLLLVLIGSFTTMLWADDPVSSVEEDRKAIAELIDRYVQGVNEKDINRTMSAFAATYSDDNYDNWAPWPLYEPFRSKAALRNGFERIMRWEVFFEVSAPKLEFSGDRAVGHVWVRECHLRNRSFVGRKRIELVKEDDAWKISRWEWDRLDDPEQRANARAKPLKVEPCWEATMGGGSTRYATSLMSFRTTRRMPSWPLPTTSFFNLISKQRFENIRACSRSGGPGPSWARLQPNWRKHRSPVSNTSCRTDCPWRHSLEPKPWSPREKRRKPQRRTGHWPVRTRMLPTRRPGCSR